MPVRLLLLTPVFGFILSIFQAFQPVEASSAPNVLIIMADDCTYNDLPLYGGKNAKTPHLDQFAKQGLTFNKAYLAEAMCQPCRAELFTGLYPMSNGCAWNHSASRPEVISLPQHLKPLGYRVGIAGKVHVKPDSVFPFEHVDGFDPNCVRDPTQQHSLTGISEFMGRDNSHPFCLVIALVDPHVPWVMGDASQYPSQKIELPPTLADTLVTRQDYGRYLAEITYMDSQVGEILAQLDELKLVEETLVLFTSEQGSQFPGNKWTNWDTGLHTALIARWPGRVPENQRTDALVQYADVVPTILDLGDAKPISKVDGTSFREVLFGKKTEHRKYVYGIHNNIPEGPAYPIRTISDGEYRYIQNLLPDEIYIEKHLMGKQAQGKLNNPYWPTWVFTAWNNPHTYELVKRYTSRPKEQFYHTTSDPYEMTNLAEDSQFAKEKEHLKKELESWMKSQEDPGIPMDTHEAIQAAKQGEHLFGPGIRKRE
ncbi:sulfatase [uncultured Rubinisphaera sp.]|uniref:sulfatase family protein n=1 Tax=uncultured Rubinisphaera sp. TaxID=1678686 RepID=UPI0030DBC12A